MAVPRSVTPTLPGDGALALSSSEIIGHTFRPGMMLYATDTGTFYNTGIGGAPSPEGGGGGGGVPDDDSVSTAKIQNDAVTFAKLQNATNNNVLIGVNSSGSGGSFGQIDLGPKLGITGNTLDVIGGIVGPAGSSSYIQFNNSGIFGASNRLTWITASNTLVINAPIAGASLQGEALDVRGSVSNFLASFGNSGNANDHNVLFLQGGTSTFSANGTDTVRFIQFAANSGAQVGAVTCDAGNLAVKSQSGTLSVIGDLKLTGSGAEKATGTVWTNPSDARIKTDIKDFKPGLSIVKEMRPVTFRFTPDSGLDTKKQHIGFIAQEMQRLVPSMVYQVDDFEKTGLRDKRMLDESSLTKILVNAIKELAARLEILEAKVQ